MATRSTIAIEMVDGRVQQVYCHWDGYLEGVGAMLNQHYTNPSKVQALVALGSVSSLEPQIDCPIGHTFNTPVDDHTVFYARDRGEDLTVNQFSDFDHYVRDHRYEEYEYILRRDGQWYVSCNGNKYQLLDKALADRLIEAAEDE